MRSSLHKVQFSAGYEFSSMCDGSSQCFSQHLATCVHHGARSVKELRITIHAGDLFWALSKCSKLGRTCLLRSAGISDLCTSLEFTYAVVVHQLLPVTKEQYMTPCFSL